MGCSRQQFVLGFSAASALLMLRCFADGRRPRLRFGVVSDVHIGDATAAVWMLKTWDAFFCNEGHGSRHDVYHPGISTMRHGENARAYGKVGDAEGAEIMQMDGQCAAAAAVMEMMVHEVNGHVRYFRGCPASWRDVAFENLRLANGKRVSGRRLDGVVEIEEREVNE